MTLLKKTPTVPRIPETMSDTVPGRLATVVVGGILSGLMGCAGEASLIKETATGGLVTFPIQSEADILSSAGRQDALRVMQSKCPLGYQVLKDGELPKVSKAADRAWGQQIGMERIWGIQFTCK